MNTLQLTETEKTAIAIIIIKMVSADKKYDKAELRFLQDLYLDYDIPLIISNRPTLTYDEALSCIRSMSQEKKDFLRRTLNELANCDSHLDKSELSFVEEFLV